MPIDEEMWLYERIKFGIEQKKKKLLEEKRRMFQDLESEKSENIELAIFTIPK